MSDLHQLTHNQQQQQQQQPSNQQHHHGNNNNNNNNNNQVTFGELHEAYYGEGVTAHVADLNIIAGSDYPLLNLMPIPMVSTGGKKGAGKKGAGKEAKDVSWELFQVRIK